MISNAVLTTPNSASASNAMKTTFGLDSTDFMKLFIAQLQYQDPLAPQDASAMLNQVSQITLVEQAYNTSAALDNILAYQNNSQAMLSMSFVGKTVRANGNDAYYNGSAPVALQYNMSAPTTETVITIKNSSGEAVRTVNIGEQSTGDLSYTWDGCDDSGLAVSAGAYTFSVSGASFSGAKVASTTYTTGAIDGVNFSGNDPYLTIGSISVPLTSIINIIGKQA